MDSTVQDTGIGGLHLSKGLGLWTHSFFPYYCITFWMDFGVIHVDHQRNDSGHRDGWRTRWSDSCQSPMELKSPPKLKRIKTKIQQIAVHLATVFKRRVRQMLPLVPEVMETWGKLRIKEGGDCIRTTGVRVNKTGRDQSFIKVSIYL